MRLVGLVCVMALGAALLAVPTLARMPAKAPRVPSRGPLRLPDRSSAEPAEAKLIDINTATVSELGTLPGIGRARAEAIVEGRPYESKDELLRRHILRANVYDAIKDRITARQS